MIPFNRRGISQVNQAYDSRRYLPNLINNRLAYQEEQPPQIPVNQPNSDERFGQNVKLPEYKMPRYAPPPDFGSEYDKINTKSANRLAYEQAIQEGAPEIPKSKWQRLGAALAGAGVSWGTKDPQQGLALTRSIFEVPQQRSDAEFERKTQGLGRLAQMDESDTDRQIRALEEKRRDWYNQQDLTLKREDSERATKLSEVQLKNIEDEMERRDLYRYTDPVTGVTYQKNLKTQKVTEVAKEQLSQAEKLEFDKKSAGAKQEGEWPWREKEIKAQSQARMNESAQEAKARESLQAAKDKAAGDRMATRLEKAAASMKPGDKNAQANLEVAAAMRADPSLNLPGIVTFDEMGVVRVADDNKWTDSKEELAAKAVLRQIVAKAVGKAAGGATDKGGTKDNDPLGIR
jgi:hypothetical protein